MTRVAAKTDRLILREWGEGDADRFYAVMNTPAVMRHLGGVQDRAKWDAAFGRIEGFQSDFGHTFWLLERKEDGELVGFCGLKRVNAGGTDLTGQFEIGWRLRESAWGKGYAKEAAIASLADAIERQLPAVTQALHRVDMQVEHLGDLGRGEHRSQFVDGHRCHGSGCLVLRTSRRLRAPGVLRGRDGSAVSQTVGVRPMLLQAVLWSTRQYQTRPRPTIR